MYNLQAGLQRWPPVATVVVVAVVIVAVDAVALPLIGAHMGCSDC